MFAKVFKSSEAAKKAWASRKRTSKDMWAKGPQPAPSKKMEHAKTMAAALGVTL